MQALGFDDFGRIPLLHRLHPLPVRQAGALPSASFRFAVARDTLAVRLTLPPAACVRDFHPQVMPLATTPSRTAPVTALRATPGAPKKRATPEGRPSVQAEVLRIARSRCDPATGSLHPWAPAVPAHPPLRSPIAREPAACPAKQDARHAHFRLPGQQVAICGPDDERRRRKSGRRCSGLAHAMSCTGRSGASVPWVAACQRLPVAPCP